MSGAPPMPAGADEVDSQEPLDDAGDAPDSVGEDNADRSEAAGPAVSSSDVTPSEAGPGGREPDRQ